MITDMDVSVVAMQVVIRSETSRNVKFSKIHFTQTLLILGSFVHRMQPKGINQWDLRHSDK
jgi:hypothetical protein